ncbi:shikimate kinase [Aridibaculum aurantiacum]|uniref:shikimate kinase n=1 Tax=Aridibaculum aurantiacum TaxID=2810307 RepID=UPI001A960778|nr:shikimate kinase [Aridibaculum aurantiacum]
MKLFLIGMPGSGKTYAAEILKKKLKIPAYDLDSLVEMMEEKTITEIFEEGGEEAFRKVEAKMLRLFKEKKKFILSTGGGTPCFHSNIDWMNKEGQTVWIDEPVEVLAERLSKELDQRPLLKGKNETELRNYLEQTLEDRKPYYEQASQKVSSKELEGSGYKKLVAEYA